MKKFDVNDFIKDLKKDLKMEVTTLQSEPMCLETDFLDTGSDSLNALISGSTKGGIPIGKITGLYGPSGCGKSFVIGKVISGAQKQGYIPILIDTEATWDERASGFGVDTGQCLLWQMDSIETIRNSLSQLMDNNREKILSGELKFIFILDSIGGLRCQKEIDDLDKDSTAVDMGTRARVLRTMFNNLVTRCGALRIPFIWSNHCYDNPASMTKSAIKNMPGGKAPWFFSSVIVMMSRREDKDEERGDMVRNKGAIIPIECVKQRFVRPNLKAQTYISYDSGLKRYYGLFEIAQELGVIEGNRTYNLSDGTKLGYKKNIINDAKLWEDVILPILDPIIQKEFGFGSEETSNVLTEVSDSDE